MHIRIMKHCALTSLALNFLYRMGMTTFKPWGSLTGKPTPNMQHRERGSCFSSHPQLHLALPGTSHTCEGPPQSKLCPHTPPHCKWLYLGHPLGLWAAQSHLRRRYQEKRPMQALQVDSGIYEKRSPGSQLSRVGASSGWAGMLSLRTLNPWEGGELRPGAPLPGSKGGQVMMIKYNNRCNTPSSKTGI